MKRSRVCQHRNRSRTFPCWRGCHRRRKGADSRFDMWTRCGKPLWLAVWLSPHSPLRSIYEACRDLSGSEVRFGTHRMYASGWQPPMRVVRAPGRCSGAGAFSFTRLEMVEREPAVACSSSSVNGTAYKRREDSSDLSGGWSLSGGLTVR